MNEVPVPKVASELSALEDWLAVRCGPPYESVQIGRLSSQSC